MVSIEKTFKIYSKAFNDGEFIPKKYTGQGQDVNPPLSWDNPPSETKSFALIVDDPDAPGATFTHWLVKNIPSDCKEIKEGSVVGEEGQNSWKEKKWKGPMPPSGVHRYYFKLYALNVDKLPNRNLDEFYQDCEKYKIDDASLMGKYKKE
jgi:Raf kinase inhibitor-like YbhB/YbcL family protein